MAFDALVADERPPDVEAAEERRGSRGRQVLRRFLRAKRGQAGLCGLLLLIVLAVAGPYLGHWTFASQDYQSALSPPNTSHFFGTDQIGQDVYLRTVRGLQKSLVIGLVGGPLATVLAATVGSVAGYFGGATDAALRWFIDLMLVLPAFFLLVILSPVLHRGGMWVVIALIAGFNWMIMAQVVRGQTRSLREREFIRAARYMGIRAPAIILRHVIPNIASLLIIDATLGVGVTVIAETTLSYFGFGIAAPDVSLGTLLAEGAPSATTYPWLFLGPAGALVALVLSAGLVGDALRDAIDPSSGVSRG